MVSRRTSKRSGTRDKLTTHASSGKLTLTGVFYKQLLTVLWLFRFPYTMCFPG